MSEEEFNDLMSATDPALIVVTTAAEDEQAGCLVGFHSQSSMAPAQYGFWLSKANHTYRVSLRSAHFAIHFLTTADLALAQHFGMRSGEESDKFAGINIGTTEDGVPLLSTVPNRMVVERIAMLDDGGDHVGVTARVVSTETTGPFKPCVCPMSAISPRAAATMSGRSTRKPVTGLRSRVMGLRSKVTGLCSRVVSGQTVDQVVS